MKMNKTDSSLRDSFAPYQRIDFEGTPIYVNPSAPDWFVPTSSAAAAIGRSLSGHAESELSQHLQLVKLAERLKPVAETVYTGRAVERQLESLKECWLHMTNRCNMSCSHCLFASGEGDCAELSREDLFSAIDQAADQGCRLFYFTGGEPLVHPNFMEASERILAESDAHLVILTNGRALPKYENWLRQQDVNRLHFQISLDGMQKNHDALRGRGSFAELQKNLRWLRNIGLSASLSMSINRNNVHEMTAAVDFTAEQGIANLHFMWLFVKGKASRDLFVSPQEIFGSARMAFERAQKKSVTIDNFTIMQSQVFNFSGIRMDLNNACWESLAIGPDGAIYPTPAMVFEDDLCCGNLSEGLNQVWRQSPLMEKIRSLSVIDSPQLTSDPLRFLLGGGDIDHSYLYSGEFVGQDPYISLHRDMALYLIAREAEQFPDRETLSLRSRMSERVDECDESGESVCFTHSNCVLTLSDGDGHASIRSFYSQAAEEVNEDIVNPVHYDIELVEHIPETARVRSYGCGSPVMDCNLQSGETLVDLGSGTGVECFIAAKQVGRQGRVYGVDMSDTMLAQANSARDKVAEQLGYANIEFKKGFLEELPLIDDSSDVIISNCVINLALNKRQTFKEIHRVLKPGGRLLISDIVHNTEVPLAIKLNEKLRGECIGGAMHERDLFGILEDFGFENASVVKRYLYREIKGYPFYSLTYQAFKPGPKNETSLLYRGPFAGVVTGNGQLIQRGCSTKVDLPANLPMGTDVMLLDDKGQVTNLEQDMSCCCLPDFSSDSDRPQVESSHKSGCLVCGEPITILTEPQELSCHYCGKLERVESSCEKGHFVCDHCHIQAAADTIRDVCLTTREKDVIAIFKELRLRPEFPTHGPHHHPMIPGILLAAYRNNGGAIGDAEIITGINRGTLVPGACCSFFGVDGAAIGVGIAFSVILKASPFNGKLRQTVQKIVIRVSEKIAENPFSRCCQRECMLALKEAEVISREMTETIIPATSLLVCDQFKDADHCAGKLCPLFPTSNNNH
jgi:7,8-dihydro-6-hydroxymethylpterin dimethyltransferase